MKADPLVSRISLFTLIAIAILASACTTSSGPDDKTACPGMTICPACPACPATGEPKPAVPPADPLQRAQWSELAGWAQDAHEQAWPAFLQSCKAIARQPRWQAVCREGAALGTNPSRASVRQFFESRFTPWQTVNPDGTRSGLVTGYYEPLIKGSRTASSEYRWPVHAPPADMLTIDLSATHPELKNLRLRGRVADNKVVPYWSREQIEKLGPDLPADVLFWAADPIDLFFLQVQGSGQVELPNGTRARIGYADQNGHPYQSIGRWLVAQGELTLEQASMESIKSWARDNPARLHEMLNTNPSYVFFRELPASSDGPIGALSVPLTRERSIAVDPRFTPLGAPVFLATTYPLSTRPFSRLMLAQDTGGAIKGPVRADLFWGFGADAGVMAGKMRQQGQMWVLLPNDVLP